MIYEVQTYDLRPQTLPDAERTLGEVYGDRARFPELVGSFHTDIGPLNQILLIWQFEDASARDRARESRASPYVDIADVVLRKRSEVFIPFPSSPEITYGTFGPFYEIRRYRFATGDLPHVIGAWEAALPGRIEWSRLIGVWHAADLTMNTMVHIWPYESLDARFETRKKIREAGEWPPLTYARKHGLPGYTLVEMENKIVVPSAFSPLR